MNSPSLPRLTWRPLMLFTGAVAVLSILVNLETIRGFPSWFDEAFMANIAFNLAGGHGRIVDLIPGYFSGSVDLYGPVYFWLQAKVIEEFGLHAALFRLPSLLAAYGAILTLALTLRLHGVSRPWWLLFCLVALVDVSVNRNLVSGRMDMLAVLFVATALALASFQSRDTWLDGARWAVVGGLSALAYLTTPRALFLLPVVAVVGVAELYRHGRLGRRWLTGLSLGLLTLSFSIPVVLWIAEAGGFSAYASLFTGSQTTRDHIGPSFFRSSYDNVGIAVMLGLVLFNLGRLTSSPLLLGLLLTYLAFSLFVAEQGPYAGMIMPFVNAATLLMLSVAAWKPLIKFVLLLVLVVPGLILVGLRGTDLIANASCRDVARVRHVCDEIIGNDRRIVAPFKYYFLLERADRQLRTTEFAQSRSEALYSEADVVIAGRMRPGRERREYVSLSRHGFHPVAEVACHSHPIPGLPGTFYERSVFDELLYGRQLIRKRDEQRAPPSARKNLDNG